MYREEVGMLNNIKIRGKIAILATTMVFLIMIIGGLGLYELSSSNTRMENMYKNNLQSIQYLEENRAHARAVLSEIFRLILLSGNPDQQKKVQEKINQRAEAFNINYEKYKKLGNKTAIEQKMQKEMEANLAEYRSGRKQVIELALEGKGKEAFAAFSSVETPAEAFLQNITDLADYNVKAAETIKADNHAKYELSFRIFIALILLAIGFGFFDTWYISKKITAPLNMAINHIGEVADYNITNDMPPAYLTRKDEVGKLSNMVQKIEDNLRALVGTMSNTSEQVAASSEQLTATAEQAASSSNEVARAIDEIANGATEQAQDTMEGAVKLNELGSAIEEDQRNIEILTQSSSKVDILVKEGLEVLSLLSDKTRESDEATQNVYTSIIKTDESSNKISEASGIITSIAQQTNLLALNASIEAARAGEHGKGFAVVAEEIRVLAEQSGSATKMIDDMVHRLQSDSREAVQIMQKMKSILEEQNSHVTSTGKKYNEMSEAMEHSSRAVDTIRNSSIQMEHKKNEVLDMMQSLSAVAEENAASSEESAASIEELTTSMDEIAHSSEGLSDRAQELYGLISKFKL